MVDEGSHDQYQAPNPTSEPPVTSLLEIPRTRSSGAVAPSSAEAPTLAVDTASASQDALSKSPFLSSLEHELSSSGLSRIRQPPSRMATYGGRATPTLSRNSSMTLLNIPSRPGDNMSLSAVPASPLMTLTEDLKRFPSESLHSFSFANHAEDSLHTRHNVLKRSLEFMRDRMGWAGSGLGIAQAQAKVSGDQEVQNMLALLTRANVVDKTAHRVGENEARLGPLTGPPASSNENLFERSFGSSDNLPKIPESGPDYDGEVLSHRISNESDAIDFATGQRSTRGSFSESPVTIPTSMGWGPQGPGNERRAALKRTFTDIGPLSLQSKLTEALAQPYLDSEGYGAGLLSPRANPSAGSSYSAAPAFPSFQAHAHGRALPKSQAIFTTTAEEPWTITAANDMACLIIGISKAEFRKTGILQLIREDKQKWLETRLKPPVKPTSANSTPRRTPSPLTSSMGNGVTARLLSKRPSRETGQGRRTKSDDGAGSSIVSRAAAEARKDAQRSRGVLLCGDVLPILKRDGTVCSASLWVQAKPTNLIWVMEEIAEDVAYLTVDEVGCVTQATGHVEAVWGMERVRRGMDITRLLPGIPRRSDTYTGNLDYDKIAELRRFTARTANDISVPVTVDQLSGESTFRVSSFPHMAGMMVLSADTLKITSSNSVVAEALFGRAVNDLFITDLIPGFDDILRFMADEENVELIEGMVIPEYSFRQARSMLAIREGREDAAAVFLRPSGLLALHRDGAEIMIDVQMRVVKSESLGENYNENVIVEHVNEEMAASDGPQIVYALWITYSKTLHAATIGVGPVSPLMSRPSTPPRQPSPRPVQMVSDDSDVESQTGVDSQSSQQHTKSDSNSLLVPRKTVVEAPLSAQRPSPGFPPDSTMPKKTINDFVILEDMGQGAYGQVKLARHKSNNCNKVVIKYVTKRRILVDTWTRDRRLGTVPLEIHVLDYLRRDGFRHPNIVEMSDFFEDDENYYIEMLPHGLPGMDLFDYIELRHMDEAECRKIFVQVASAVQFLHVKAKVVHRDIKDENVILDGEGNIKLIDFGSAAYIKNGPFNVFVGTIDYAAPEVLHGLPYSGPAQDIWALGILLYTIIYKENPFYSINEILDQPLRVPFEMSSDSIHLVREMLNRDVEKRIDIGGVVAHPWCAGMADWLGGRSGGEAAQGKENEKDKDEDTIMQDVDVKEPEKEKEKENENVPV